MRSGLFILPTNGMELKQQSRLLQLINSLPSCRALQWPLTPPFEFNRWKYKRKATKRNGALIIIVDIIASRGQMKLLTLCSREYFSLQIFIGFWWNINNIGSNINIIWHKLRDHYFITMSCVIFYIEFSILLVCCVVSNGDWESSLERVNFYKQHFLSNF